MHINWRQQPGGLEASRCENCHRISVRKKQPGNFAAACAQPQNIPKCEHEWGPATATSPVREKRKCTKCTAVHFRSVTHTPETAMEPKIEVTTVTYVSAPGIGARVDVSTLNADQLARGVEEIQAQIDRLAKVPGQPRIIRARIRELENGMMKLVNASNKAFDAKTADEEEPERAGGTD